MESNHRRSPASPDFGKDLSVSAIMQREVVTVSSDTTIRDLVAVLARHEIGGAPVVDDQGALVGIVSASDIVRLAARAAESPLDELFMQLGPAVQRDESARLFGYLASEVWPRGEEAGDAAPDGDEGVAGGAAYEEYTVREIMQPAPQVVRSSDPLRELARVLLAGRMHRAPVVEDGRLVGIVTTYDILRLLAEPD